MIYVVATVFVVLGGALLALSSPFAGPQHGLLDFSDIFWYGQWSGFWLLALSLLLFLLDWLQSPGRYRPLWQWEMLPPSAAILLCLAFVAFTMPERSNQRPWPGKLGVGSYARTKLGQHAAAQAILRISNQFSGKWMGTDGQRQQFSTERGSGRATCGDSFQLDD